jgi:hypothetical protein
MAETRPWTLLFVRLIVAGGMLIAGGCGSDHGAVGHIEISGKTPGEGAAIAARAVCTRDASCGRVSIACMGGGSAGGSGSDAGFTMMCTATIQPINYSDCYADAAGDIQKLLSCPALTPQQVNELEVCFDMLAALKCMTQAEADAQARASAAGAAPPPTTRPPECELLVRPPAGC